MKTVSLSPPFPRPPSLSLLFYGVFNERRMMKNLLNHSHNDWLPNNYCKNAIFGDPFLQTEQVWLQVQVIREITHRDHLYHFTFKFNYYNNFEFETLTDPNLISFSFFFLNFWSAWFLAPFFFLVKKANLVSLAVFSHFLLRSRLWIVTKS